MEYRKLIILPVYNQDLFIQKNLLTIKDLNTDVLMVDDGSTDHTYNVIKKHTWFHYIKHERTIGTGASIITGYEYARDMGYDIIITLDLHTSRFREELSQLMENISYGYDVVNSSRILENYNYREIPTSHISITSELSARIKNITCFDLTDPLSGIKAMRMDALKNMELTELSHGLFLQLWIQVHYFGCTVIEIPAQSGSGFGEELKLYNDPLGMFLSLLETEKYLYSKNNLH